MNRSFRAYRIKQNSTGIKGQVETLAWDDLSPNDVIIEGHYSSVNYKDALAGMGRGKILKRFPLTGGIDFAGTVVSAKSKELHVGDPVIMAAVSARSKTAATRNSCQHPHPPLFRCQKVLPLRKA